MAQFSFSGSFNTTGLVVPDIYVAITPPTLLSLNGVPTNIAGVVGTASYGPVNIAVVGGNASDYVANFGPLQNRKYDMGTVVYAAIQQGGSAFVFVRVTDGTDIAATAPAQTNNAVVSPSFVAPFTGSGGAGTVVSIQPGRMAGSWAAVVTRPGRVLERFDDNFTTWGQVIAGINGGVQRQNQPASALVAAVTGTATIAGVPSAMTFTLAGGTDGAGVSPAQLVGTDGLVPTGSFLLRGQGCMVGACADLDTSSYWPTIDALASSEGIYFQHAYPNGTPITTAITAQSGFSLSAYAKTLYGDWLWWYDTTNTVNRMISPQGFALGKMMSLGPQQSGLNKPMSGIIGSYFTGQNGGNAFSNAQLQALFQQGIDIITNPIPAGSYWGLHLGHNASQTPATWSDVYPKMTSFIARTLGAGMGIYNGRTINDDLFINIRSTLLGYFSTLLSQGVLGTLGGVLPYAVVCDATNNPQTRTALGYVQADCQVRYMGINEKFIVNLQGGQGVTITSATGT